MLMAIKGIIIGTVLAAVGLGVAQPSSEELRTVAVVKYGALAEASYAECVEKAEALRVAVDEFIAKPDEKTLAAAREAWKTARIPFRRTEVFRFYAGPIDDDDGIEHLLNSWPLDESYIEKVPGASAPGLVENVQDFPKLTTELLDRLNERGGEKNITCGWHAIEFLLWGQDLRADGCGDRPVTDYTTHPHAYRRAELLRLTVCKLVEDLRYVANDWKPGELGNYRAIWLEGTDISFANALTGAALLCEFELAGSRILVPYDTQEQEEEHSCFSDTTHLDHQGNLEGVAAVWEILKPVAAAKDAAAAESISALLANARLCAAKIPAPFDQAILGPDSAPGRTAVKALLIAVEDLGQALRKLGDTLSVEIPDSLEIVE